MSIAPWPIRYRNWLKRHKPNAVVGFRNSEDQNPIVNFLEDKIGFAFVVKGVCFRLAGQRDCYPLPDNVRDYLLALNYSTERDGIQARTALRLLEEG